MAAPPQNVAKTLTGGIQDMAALLPLLGTDQCEKHVGSALDGGFLYAAAAPLSIFGSLGIVKMGISVLISSISIPRISISNRKFSIQFSQDLWLGARTLDNAGFKPVGTVAPLIAMDGTRYTAETRLMQILEEKHIENPENISIEWKSRGWNVGLVAFTVVVAAISVTPYVALLSLNSRPSVIHTPWIFPLLRTIGSCLAAVCCQFLIQSRVISLMKNRIIFMVMNRVLLDDLKLKHNHTELDLRHEEHLRWDLDLPAEQCLWRLKHFLPLFTQSTHGSNEPGAHVSIEMKRLCFSDPEHIRVELQQLHNEHFPTPAFHHAYVLVSWTILCLSLPAAIAGYIGCFMLVSDSQNNGPVVWLGLEAALSILRILVWAWNPLYDENTGITVKLGLTNDQPFVTTEKDDKVITSTGNNTLTLVPELQFLEWITPYTGPLEQFQCSENVALYFTLTASGISGPEHKHLYMTVFDLNKRIAVTLHMEREGLMYVDATLTCNRIASEMEATLQSVIGKEHPRRTSNVILFDALENYYKAVLHALNRTPDNLQPVTLRWKWNFLAKDTESDNPSPDQVLKSPPLTEHDWLYLCRGYEHHLKTELIENWARWIVEGMSGIHTDARIDCHHALADAASDKAIWELTELDMQLAWEWTRRELSLVVSSIALEGILRGRMEECIDKVSKERRNGRLKEWMWSEFLIGQRKRLEKERAETTERMEKEMKGASERAERERRLWRNQGRFNPQTRWEAGLKFIDKRWLAGLEGRNTALENAVFDLDQVIERGSTFTLTYDEKTRRTFVKQIRQRFEHWHPQRENEQREMEATINRIRVESENLEGAYRYPQIDSRITGKFVHFSLSQAQAKFCSANVYEVKDYDKEVICDVVMKSTTRSVIEMDPALVDSIPENDHLLYIGSDGGKEPAFVQRNRDRWWDQQTNNSSTFYFSPQAVASDGHSVFGLDGTIAHIFIFLTTSSRLRLCLLHRRGHHASVSIQENSIELRRIPTNQIPEEFRLQDFELDKFGPGRHHLELVVTGRLYCLRDILIEFFDDPPSPSSMDKDGDNPANTVEHGDADGQPGEIQTTDIEEGGNANVLPLVIENEVPL